MADGPGLFTTMRVAGGAAWLWEGHVRRLDAAPELGLAPPDPQALRRAVAAAVGDLPDARVRITLRPGLAPRIEASAYAPPLDPWRLRPVTASPGRDTSRLKTTDRRRYEEAAAAREDADDALLVDPGGAALECSVANVFFVHGDRLTTPPATAPILAGLAREAVLGVAAASGLACREAPLDRAAAVRADACFVTNALFLVHPVRTIEGWAEYADSPLVRGLRNAIVRKAPKTRIIR